MLKTIQGFFLFKNLKKLGTKAVKLSDDKPSRNLNSPWRGLKRSFPELKDFLSSYPRYIVFLGVVTFIPFVLAFIIFMICLSSAPTLVMPKLEGLSLIDAGFVVQDKKLSLKIVPEDSTEYPKNFIIYQDIPAGRKIKEGRTVSLYVSNGSTSINFPSLVGKNIFTVETNLDRQDTLTHPINIKNVFWVASQEPFGSIIQQNPSSGNYKDFPIFVDFVVSNGSGSPLPSFVGQDASTAFDQAKQLHLDPILQIIKSNDSSQDGKVITQIPAAGSPLAQTTSIQFTIGEPAKSHIQYFTYDVGPEADRKVISIILNDDRGKTILFSGYVLADDHISIPAQLHGTWKAGIYTTDNGNDVLLKDLTA